MRHPLPNRCGATGSSWARGLLLLRVPGEVAEVALQHLLHVAWPQHLLQNVRCGAVLAPCPSVLHCLLMSPPPC